MPREMSDMRRDEMLGGLQKVRWRRHAWTPEAEGFPWILQLASGVCADREVEAGRLDCGKEKPNMRGALTEGA